MSEYLDRIINEAEENVAKLLTVLFSENRMDDAKRVVVDAEYRHQLMKELLSVEM